MFKQPASTEMPYDELKAQKLLEDQMRSNAIHVIYVVSPCRVVFVVNPVFVVSKGSSWL